MKLLAPRPPKNDHELDDRHIAIAVAIVIALLMVFGLMTYLKFGAHPI